MEHLDDMKTCHSLDRGNSRATPLLVTRYSMFLHMRIDNGVGLNAMKASDGQPLKTAHPRY